MFGRNIYRDEAVLGHAQQEPLDTPARVDAPHQHIAMRILAALCLLAVVWIALGTKERELWLTPVSVTGSPSTQVAPNTVLEVSSYVTEAMIPHLRAGMEVDLLFRQGAKRTGLQGTLISLQRASDHSRDAHAPQNRSQLGEPYRFVIRVSAVEPIDNLQGLHRLRLVIGHERLYEFLAQLVSHQT